MNDNFMFAIAGEKYRANVASIAKSLSVIAQYCQRCIDEDNKAGKDKEQKEVANG